MRKHYPYNKQPGVLLVQLNFYFIFAVFHTKLLAYSQEYDTQTPYLSDCAVHRVPLHKCTGIPASKSTSTKQFSHFNSTL